MQGSRQLAAGQARLPRMPFVEETVTERGSPTMEVQMDDGLLGAIEHELATI